MSDPGAVHLSQILPAVSPFSQLHCAVSCSLTFQVVGISSSQLRLLAKRDWGEDGHSFLDGLGVTTQDLESQGCDGEPLAADLPLTLQLSHREAVRGEGGHQETEPALPV